MASAYVQQQRPPSYQQPAASRRPTNYGMPSNNVYQQQQQQFRQPPPLQQKEMQPPPAPLPRQNSKTVPPSPPKTIRDASNSHMYTRIGFLGEGGFARVYEVADLQGSRHAIKVVTKTSLKTKKSRTKLYAEIRLHRSLEHPNIVGFENCFEDGENVYMTLELCENGSMMDMLRRRKRFSEPESRFFLIQILGACHYMHVNQVIHRDLKLGNLFLDANMNIKVGDFGLAALIETPGERKKTICGTPNYIAPEVLFDTANGHSFEVDTWSIGVIVYTLVVGKPPFQTKDVKAIYQRIRDNAYEFPTDRVLSPHVRTLIRAILTQDPKKRPTLHEIVDHPFFTDGIVPLAIPATAHDEEPYFGHLTQKQSLQNFYRLRRRAGLDEETIDMTSLSAGMSSLSVVTSSAIQRQRESAAQQAREFAKAIQPGSPISTLLSSARQPLMKAQLLPSAPRDPPGGLLRKLAAAAPSSAPSERHMNNGGRPLTPLVEQDEEDAVAIAKTEKERIRELESQKARIVAQMVPGLGQSNEDDDVDIPEQEPRQPQQKHNRNLSQPAQEPRKPRDKRWGGTESDANGDERENVPPSATGVHSAQENDRGTGEDRRRRAASQVTSRPTAMKTIDPSQQPTTSIASNLPSKASVASLRSIPHSASGALPALASSTSTNPMANTRTHGFDTVAQTLSEAFDAKDDGMSFADPYARHPDRTPVFIVSWVDYCNKYGMGYALTDGTIGVHFNDSTTLLLSPDKLNLDYISSRRSGTVNVRKHHLTDVYPDEIQNKVYLLRHFEAYMLDRLYGQHSFCYQDLERTKNLDFVQKYFRMKNVIVFKLSHEVLQFNFCDHTKMILSSKGHFITYLDKNYNLTHHRLATVIERAVHPPSDPEVKKSNERLLNKLRYCKEVLLSIQQVSQAAMAAAAGPAGDREASPQSPDEDQLEDGIDERGQGGQASRRKKVASTADDDGNRGGRYYQ